MTTLNIDLYDALKEAKVSEEKARAAAASLADTERVVADQSELKADVKQLKSDSHELKLQFIDLRGRTQLLQWMIAFNLAATMAVLWKLIK